LSRTAAARFVAKGVGRKIYRGRGNGKKTENSKKDLKIAILILFQKG